MCDHQYILSFTFFSNFAPTMQKTKDTKSLRFLTKGTIWDMQESDIFFMWQKPDKEDAAQEHAEHYMDIIKTAFDVEEVPNVGDGKGRLAREIEKKYEARGMRVGVIPIRHKDQKWAIKKKPINRVTDLTYENIRHISAAKLLEIIDRNFGGGWDSLNQGVKDIILSGFDISTNVVPAERLKRPGGLYELKMADGYECLEIEKGGWVEAIFAKVKPMSIKPRLRFNDEEGLDDLDDGKKRRKRRSQEDDLDDDLDGDDSDDDMDYKYSVADEDDLDDIDEDELTAESYRTTIEEDPDDLSLDAADLSDDDY